MDISTNDFTGSIRITADVPDNAALPGSGYFAEVTVDNWIAYATVPVMVELVMNDGTTLVVWPDGTFLVKPRPSDREHGEYSLKITIDGVVPNPYRS